MLKVLFVSNTSRLNRPYFDPSVRYRCYNIAEELVKQGHFCRVASADFFMKNDIEQFDVYIFHRPPFSPLFVNKVEELKEKNKLIIADYDDLIFDVENALNSSLYKTGRAGQREVLNIFSRNAAALSIFDFYTVSTTSLAKRLKELSPSAEVQVIHNSLTEKYKSICDHIRNNENVERIEGRVGYFSGTKSHDKDLEYISSALSHVCSKDKHREILFVGPVDIPDLIKDNCKVITSPLVGYHEMIKLLCSCEVIIAPLETSLFNDCKSGLKYFESAYAGCNVVATPIPDMSKFISENLYLPGELSDWFELLENAITDFGKQSETERLLSASSQADIIKEVSKWTDFIYKLLG